MQFEISVYGNELYIAIDCARDNQWPSYIEQMKMGDGEVEI